LKIGGREEDEPVRLRAARGELVLEAEEIKEIKLAAGITVGKRLARGEGVLEAEEVEEVEVAAFVAVGVALDAVDHGYLEVVKAHLPEAGHIEVAGHRRGEANFVHILQHAAPG